MTYKEKMQREVYAPVEKTAYKEGYKASKGTIKKITPNDVLKNE